MDVMAETWQSSIIPHAVHTAKSMSDEESSHMGLIWTLPQAAIVCLRGYCVHFNSGVIPEHHKALYRD